MKLKEAEPGPYVVKEEYPLSNVTLTEFIQNVFDKGWLFRFQVKGYSMSPFIKDGDVVIISPLDNKTIGLGMPVAFIHPCTGKLVIHRIVGRRKNSYIIKGDNVREADGLVPKESLLGFVVNVERKGKKVFLGLGPERILITLLSHNLSFFYLLLSVYRIFRQAIRFAI